MKILMVSMFSPHFFNWTEQLKESGHEIYWLDVFDSNTYNKKIDFVEQIIGWRNRWDYPGRHKIKRHSPGVYKVLNFFNQRNIVSVFEKKIKEIKPDLVQSFVMYSACVPLLEVMKRNPEISWLYSAWGNDLFYYQNIKKYRDDMVKVFPYLNYMFADCNRDITIARKLGFRGEVLGVYPGGGGYKFLDYHSFILPREERNIILIKGYQSKFGRCIPILKALMEIIADIKHFQIIVFGATKNVLDFVNNNKEIKQLQNLNVLGKIEHNKVLKLMGQSYIYVGNSISDGMPNTLLEAIVMEVFPIQSDPGGATSEIITHNKNGLLIKNPEDSNEIAKWLLLAIKDKSFVQQAVNFNSKEIKPSLKRDVVRMQVLEKYNLIEKNIINNK